MYRPCFSSIIPSAIRVSVFIHWYERWDVPSCKPTVCVSMKKMWPQCPRNYWWRSWFCFEQYKWDPRWIRACWGWMKLSCVNICDEDDNDHLISNRLEILMNIVWHIGLHRSPVICEECIQQELIGPKTQWRTHESKQCFSWKAIRDQARIAPPKRKRKSTCSFLFGDFFHNYHSGQNISPPLDL